MFGLFKRTVQEPVKFVGGFKGVHKDFLKAADEAYLLTFKSKDMRHFAKFATRALYMVVYRTLSMERPWAGISDKFRETTWNLVELNQDGSFIASKSTTFDKVAVSKQLKLSVADDYTELWYVTTSSNGGLIVDKITNV